MRSSHTAILEYPSHKQLAKEAYFLTTGSQVLASGSDRAILKLRQITMMDGMGGQKRENCVQGLAYAWSISSQVVAEHVTLDELEEKTFHRRWRQFQEQLCEENTRKTSENCDLFENASEAIVTVMRSRRSRMK